MLLRLHSGVAATKTPSHPCEWERIFTPTPRKLDCFCDVVTVSDTGLWQVLCVRYGELVVPPAATILVPSGLAPLRLASVLCYLKAHDNTFLGYYFDSMATQKLAKFELVIL